jgi:Domain of unknown function (DUF1906)/Uncharacterized protein conserved in bacteria (DUF2272)
MTYKSDFENDDGWSAVDTNVKLDTEGGKSFRDYLKTNNVTTIVRYYASTQRAKTLSADEAKVISADGFNMLPVFQDRNRETEDFGAALGKSNARSALEFARDIGQPRGSSILFAVDTDFGETEVRDYVVPYFESIRREIGSNFKIGAYGSGLVLQTLIDEDLIDIPWISMSRAFHGTKDFFYSNSWALRQVPPDLTHQISGIGYDRNVLRLPPGGLGAFRVATNGAGVLSVDERQDATLGGTRRRSPAAPAARTTAAPNAYVSTDSLNLRAAPDGPILEELNLGQPVTDLGPADVPGWRKVRVNGTDGFAFGKYLRPPTSPAVEALIASAVAQWLRFDRGRADEEQEPYYRYVGEMWASIGQSYDGRSRYANGEEVPWSAAFISYVVKRAGPAYANFKFAASHSQFSNDAIQARILNRTSKPFWGYRREEQKPEIGDIVHRNRGPGAYTFDYAENHSEFTSHSDIVVEVTPHVARVLGGNVSDTVTMSQVDGSGDDIQEYVLDQNGFIAPGQRIIALLKNRAQEV